MEISQSTNQLTIRPADHQRPHDELGPLQREPSESCPCCTHLPVSKHLHLPAVFVALLLLVSAAPRERTTQDESAKQDIVTIQNHLKWYHASGRLYDHVVYLLHVVC